MDASHAIDDAPQGYTCEATDSNEPLFSTLSLVIAYLAAADRSTALASVGAQCTNAHTATAVAFISRVEDKLASNSNIYTALHSYLSVGLTLGVTEGCHRRQGAGSAVSERVGEQSCRMR